MGVTRSSFSGGSGFEYQPVDASSHRDFHGFTNPWRQILWWKLKLRHLFLLPDPFQFSITNHPILWRYIIRTIIDLPYVSKVRICVKKLWCEFFRLSHRCSWGFIYSGRYAAPLFFPQPRCPETSVRQSLSDAVPHRRRTKTSDNDIIVSLVEVMLTLHIRYLSTSCSFYLDREHSPLQGITRRK